MTSISIPIPTIKTPKLENPAISIIPAKTNIAPATTSIGLTAIMFYKSLKAYIPFLADVEQSGRSRVSKTLVLGHAGSNPAIGG